MAENINNNKILFHAERILGNHKPITADIFLTNYCNNKCPYCTYKRWELDKNANYMSFNDFVLYAERLINFGVLGLILTGGGEPTLNPDFDRITKWLEDNNVHYGINTNFNVYKSFHPDYLKVSLDGYDEESYERCRGVRKYKEVRNNIIKYCKDKKNTNVGIQFVVSSASEMIKFYEANKDLNVDYISLRPIESTGGKYYKDKDINDIIKALDNLVKKDNRVVKNFKWNMLKEKQNSCVANWAQIALNEKGEVIYCCHKPYEIIGHILDEDILEKKEKALTNMAKCDIPCRMTAPNKCVKNFLKNRLEANFL